MKISVIVITLMVSQLVCGAILNAGVGLLLMEAKPVYIPRKTHRLIMAAEIPCYNHLKVEEHMAAWTGVLDSSVSWVGKIDSDGTSAPHYKALQEQVQIQAHELTWRIQRIRASFGDLLSGQSGLNQLIDYKERCSPSLLQDDPRVTSGVSKLALLLSNHSDKKKLDRLKPQSINMSFPSWCHIKDDVLDCVMSPELASSDAMRTYLTSQNVTNIMQLHADDPLWDLLRPLPRSAEELKQAMVSAGLIDLEQRRSRSSVFPDAPIQNSLWDEVPEELWDKAGYEYQVNKEYEMTPRTRRSLGLSEGDTLSFQARYMCSVSNREIHVYKDDELQAIMHPPNSTIREVSSLVTAKPSPPPKMRKSVSQDQYRPLTQECICNTSKTQYIISDSDKAIRTKLMKSVSSSHKLFNKVLKLQSVLPGGPAIGVYQCFIPPGVKEVPYDTRDMLCTWYDYAQSIDVPSCLIDTLNDDPASHIDNMIDHLEDTSCTQQEALAGLCNPVQVRRRSKRGLGDWMMDNMWTPMFGSASKRDVRKISVVAKKLQKQNQVVDENNKVIWTMLNTTGGQLVKLSKAVTLLEGNLANWTHSVSAHIDRIEDLMKETTTTLDDMAVWQQIQGMIQSINIASDNMITTFDEMARSQSNLYKMFVSKYLDPSVFSDDMLVNIHKSLRQSSSDPLTTPPGWNTSHVFTENIASVWIHNLTIITVLEVPLINKAKSYHTYRAYPVPMKVAGWREIILPNEFIIATESPEMYATVDHARYLQCLGSPARVCPSPETWVLKNPNDCLSAVLFPNDPSIPVGGSTKLCIFDQYPESRVVPLAHAVSNTQWLISPGKNVSILYESCEGDGNKSQSSSKITVLSLINVTPGCRAQMGDYLMESVDIWDEHATGELRMSSMPVLREDGFKSDLFKTVDEVRDRAVELSKAWEALPVIGAKPIKSGTLVEITRAIEDSFAELQKTHDSLKNITLVPIAEDPADLPSSLGDLFDQYINNIIGWSVIVIGVILALAVVYCLWSRYKIPAGLSIPSVLFHKVPNTYASNITSPSSNTSLIGRVFNVSTMINDTTHYYSKDYEHVMLVHLFTMIIVMALLMLLHQWATRTFVNGTVSKYSSRLGLIPMNVKGIHHSGEQPVVVTVVLKFDRLWLASVSRTASLQLTTLPGVPSDWYRKVSTSPWNLVRQYKSYRLIDNIRFGLDWTHMCLLSTRYANLDICAEMPPLMQFSPSELTEAMGCDPPSLWYSVTIVGLAKLSVGHGETSNTIYLSGASSSSDNELKRLI